MVRIEDLPSECFPTETVNANEKRNGKKERIKSANYDQSPQSNTAYGCLLTDAFVHPQSSPLVDSNDEEKGNSQLGSLDCISVKHDIHSSFKRCKRNVSMRDTFPEELVFNLLLWLPAQFIHDVMRCVCRQWYAMIRTRHFIYAHLLQSTAGLIVFRPTPPNAFFVAMQQGGLEVSKFRLGFKDVVWSSCNGLVLVGDPVNRGLLLIVNPITKQWLTLPPFFDRIDYAHAGLGFVAASQKYKVVYPYGDKYIFGHHTAKCAILTIGVDKVWRHIDVQHLVPATERFFGNIPRVTGEFMHWIHRKNIVSTLNLQTETIMQFPVPPVAAKSYLGMGSNLSFLARRGRLSWEIWEMKSETGEWTKLRSIDLKDQRCKLELLFCTHECKLFPVCWLKPREVLVFRVSKPSNLCIVYDFKTEKIDSFELEHRDHGNFYVTHVNSLVWLEGR